jgi:heavy metal translocating P-type ATPase
MAVAHIKAKELNSPERARRLQFLRYPAETYISATAIAGLLAHLALRYVFQTPPSTAEVPLVITLVAGGTPLIAQLVRRLIVLDFGSDLLAGIAIMTSVLVHEYLVGAIVVLMLSGGAALEQYATRRASSVLEALAQRMPSVAHRRTNSGFCDVGLEELQIGDALILLPHEISPVDGVVLEGNSAMDESYLTGEPYEMAKAPGSDILSGAVNGGGILTIRASHLPQDSRYATIVRIMEVSEQKRPKLRRMADRLGAVYTATALGLAAASWIVTGDATRFLAVLVIATPCPLLIGIPVAIIGAISLAAHGGIIIKDPAILERLDRCRTFIFDKTGTLTYGRPRLTKVVCAPGYSRSEVLTAAASLELYSKHPLAGAVLCAADEEGQALKAVTLVSEKPGEGMRGIVDGKLVQITSRKNLLDTSADLPACSSGLECVVLVEDKYVGLLLFHDEPRPESRPFIRHLGPRHNADKVILLSGDREAEVHRLASELGIFEAYSGKTPEEKVVIVERETRLQETLYVGDGLNDAPAMMAATVAVALGQRSDVTSEAAGAVVLDSDLTKVDSLIHIGRRMRRIALQSAIGGIAFSIAGMIVAAAGYLPPVAGVIFQEAIDLAAVLNALRVSFPTSDSNDIRDSG